MNVKLSEAKPSINLQQLQEVEQTIGRILPEQYKAFLLKTNGGRPKPSAFRIQWNDQEWAANWQVANIDFFLSVNESDSLYFLKYYSRYKDRIPNDTVCIAHDPGRSQILLGVDQHKYNQVFFWVGAYEVEEGETPDYSNVGFVANSFNEFIDSIYDDE